MLQTARGAWTCEVATASGGRYRERNEAQCSNDNKPFRRCSWSLLSTRGRSLSSLTTPAKKKDIHWMSFFSYICLWQVILLRSYIWLTPSDIVLSHSIKAKIISLKRKFQYHFWFIKNITPSKMEYHYFCINFPSCFIYFQCFRLLHHQKSIKEFCFTITSFIQHTIP